MIERTRLAESDEEIRREFGGERAFHAISHRGDGHLGDRALARRVLAQTMALPGKG